MPGYADCYVLVKARSKKFVEEFLAHFLSNHRPLADEYEMPQFSEKPDQVFQADGDALSYLEEHPNPDYSLKVVIQSSWPFARGQLNDRRR